MEQNITTYRPKIIISPYNETGKTQEEARKNAIDQYMIRFPFLKEFEYDVTLAPLFRFRFVYQCGNEFYYSHTAFCENADEALRRAEAKKQHVVIDLLEYGTKTDPDTGEERKLTREEVESIFERTEVLVGLLSRKEADELETIPQ